MKLREWIYSLLRKSERYTKTDMVYLAKGGGWLFSGQGISVIASLFLALAFANLIDPEEYGNYKYVLSLAGIVSTLTLSGLGTAVMRAVARNHEGTLSYAFRMSLFWSVGMIIISAIGGVYYLLHDNQFLGFSLFIIGVASPIATASALYQPFLLGKRDFKRAALFGVMQSIFPTLSVLLTLLLKAPLLALVGIYFLANTLTLYILYNKTKQLSGNDNIDPIANSLGKHLSLMGILTVVAGKLDSILIFQLLGGTQLAVFSLATAVPDMIRGSLKHITSLATPKFAAKTKEEMKTAVWSKTKIVFLVTALISLSYIITAPFLFTILFPKYIASIHYSQVYSLTLLTSLLVASAYFDSQVAVKERYILTVVINATAILSVVLGIYWFGLWGAIFARLFTRIINVSLSAYLIKQH
jgi:O-antigen/teichoic acid export membrane protein